MKLWYSKTSPYARKAIVTLRHHHLEQKVSLLETTMAFDAKAPHNVDNPFGRIPAFQTDSGQWLYGSYLIADYLDHFGQNSPLIPSSKSRLADGILENAMIVVAERMMRKESDWWHSRQEQLLERCLRSFAQLEKDLDAFEDDLNMGTLTAVCLVDWWLLRQSVLGVNLEDEHPFLIKWAAQMNQRYPELADSWAPLA